MFWEKITIEGASTIVLERDIIRDVIRWSVQTGRHTATGEVATVAEALREAIKASKDHQREIDDDALRESIFFDHFDR